MENSFDFKIGGLRELNDALEQLPQKLAKKALQKASRAGGNVFRDEARRLCPEQEGKLKKSIRVGVRVNVDEGTATAKIRAGNKEAFYPHMVEFGTLPHIIAVEHAGEGFESLGPQESTQARRSNKEVRQAIFGRGRKAKKFQDRTEGHAAAALKLLNGQLVEAVHHPGAKAEPFMRPACDTQQEAASEAVADALRDEIGNL